MDKNKKRPKFLNLFQISMPVTAVLSITHRITGVLMALLIPVGLYLFDLSLQSEDGYREVTALFEMTGVKVVTLLMLWSLCIHFFAGLRFLIIDFDIGVLKPQARQSAWFVFGLSTVCAVLLLVAWL